MNNKLTEKQYALLLDHLKQGTLKLFLLDYVRNEIEKNITANNFATDGPCIVYDIKRGDRWLTIIIDAENQTYTEKPFEYATVDEMAEHAKTPGLNEITPQKIQNEIENPITIDQLRPGMFVRIKPLEEAKKCREWVNAMDNLAGNVWEIENTWGDFFYIKNKMLFCWDLHLEMIAEIVEDPHCKNQKVDQATTSEKMLIDKIQYGEKSITVEYTVHEVPVDMPWMHDDPDFVPPEQR